MNDEIIQPDQPISLYRFENFFNIYNDKNYEWLFYNFLKNVNIVKADDSSIEDEYTILAGDSWPYISYKYYSTIDLWWLVFEYNGFKNPTVFPEIGTKIKLIKPSFVYPILTELKKQFNR